MWQQQTLLEGYSTKDEGDVWGFPLSSSLFIHFAGFPAFGATKSVTPAVIEAGVIDWLCTEVSLWGSWCEASTVNFWMWNVKEEMLQRRPLPASHLHLLLSASFKWFSFLWNSLNLNAFFHLLVFNSNSVTLRFFCHCTHISALASSCPGGEDIIETHPPPEA